jgi:hypothetical protein
MREVLHDIKKALSKETRRFELYLNNDDSLC